MEQRPLRLGDILDDYCPRERRVTNHAVVAMIEDTVKQTRCTTCDADHPYKGGQAPRRRKKGTAAGPVLTETETHLPSALATADTPDDNLQDRDNGFDGAPVLVPGLVPGEVALDEPLPMEASADEVHDEPIGDEPIDLQPESLDNEFDDRQPETSEVEGPVHRRLIRATLPRPEGQKDERRPPDFTIRQNGGRGNVAAPSFRGGNNPRVKVRGGGGGSVHGGNGHRPSGGSRFGGARPGQGQGQGRGQGGGFRSAQPPRHGGGGGGRKRSR
jgi:hypothetical protein